MQQHFPSHNRRYWESGVLGDRRGFKLWRSSVPKVTARRIHANSQYGRQDPPDPEARRLTDHNSEQSAKNRESGHLSLLEGTRRKHPEEPVVVTLSSEFQVSLTQPSRKKTRIAKKSSKYRQYRKDKRNEKQKWAIEKPKVDKVGNYVVFTSLILMTRNSRIPWENLAERCKFWWQPQCIAKFRTLHKYLEDHIAGKGMNWLVNFNFFCTNLFPCQAMGTPDPQAADIQGMGTDENQKQDRGDRWSLGWGSKTLHFWTLTDLCHLNLGATVRKIWRQNCVPRWDCAQYFSTRSISIKNDGSKFMDAISRLPIFSGQAAVTRFACTQVRMEDAPKSLKIPKSECLDIWIHPPRHKWLKSWSSVEDPVVPLERNLHGHPRTVMGKAIGESSDRTRLGNSSELRTLVRTPRRRIFLSVHVNEIKVKQNIDVMWIEIMTDIGQRTSKENVKQARYGG